MILTSISLSDFRNVEKETIDFSEGITALIGENAQGKTNLLEAVYLLSCGKSFRNRRWREMIAFDKEKSVVSADIRGKGLPFELKIELDRREGKKISHNSHRLEKLSEFLGLFRVVLFCPEHLQLVKGAPKLRRSFLDSAICQLRPYYASLLNEFLKTEEQRAALLKEANQKKVSADWMEIWEERLARVSGQIAFLRSEYIRELKSEAAEQYEKISSGREKLSLHYKSDVFEEKMTSAEMAERYREILIRNRESDIRYGFTQKGVHKDDLEIRIDARQATSFSSQGQQRSAVLALKLSEGEISRRQTGESPLYLFDDVLSELDEKRREFITSGVLSGQVIITGTDRDNFEFTPNKIFVRKGKYSVDEAFS